mgnify:CR=1 FL=1
MGTTATKLFTASGGFYVAAAIAANIATLGTGVVSDSCSFADAGFTGSTTG